MIGEFEIFDHDSPPPFESGTSDEVFELYRMWSELRAPVGFHEWMRSVDIVALLGRR